MVETRVYRCQGVMPNGMKCGRFTEYHEDNDLWLCTTCHRKHMRAIGTKIQGQIELSLSIIPYDIKENDFFEEARAKS